MKAIVDCNSFYCSCERLFRPDLMNIPVVVLSNNDGCIVSRSDEAKELGVEMAGPYFLAKPVIEKYGIATFSSNYNLYGDLSRRVMETLQAIAGGEKVEVYSVDEAFVDLDIIADDELFKCAQEMKANIEKWTGISVSIGIAPTKTLAKLANHIAKKNKKQTGCITILATKEQQYEALKKAPVGSLWGVGRAYAEKLMSWGINTAADLASMPPDWVHRHLGGVVGLRLLKELNGEPSIGMEDPLIIKKMIATTRMFGTPVTSINDIKEAIATYTSRAAEKLRRQYSAAKTISIFVVPREESHSTHFRHGPMLSSHAHLPLATSITNELIKPAVQLVDELFEEGRTYKKAGVMLSG
ncbi:MAG TPA: Y-family DNA polymerase, partial [Ferruginibacter sp.]|nr:Y-family DNA polymerase [Ferruginibacter sp.]